MSKKHYIRHPHHSKIHFPVNFEMWETIEGYEGYYEISSWGRVRSLSREVSMRDGRTRRHKGRIMKLAWDGHYHHVIFYKDKKAKVCLVHRLVLGAFIGPCPEGMEGCHCDGNSKNNRLENLRWDTCINNRWDRMKHGTNTGQRPGEGNTHAKLNKSDVIKIRKRVASGESNYNLAAEYGVSEATIRDIKTRRSWNHI